MVGFFTILKCCLKFFFLILQTACALFSRATEVEPISQESHPAQLCSHNYLNDTCTFCAKACIARIVLLGCFVVLIYCINESFLIHSFHVISLLTIPILFMDTTLRSDPYSAEIFLHKPRGRRFFSI